MAGVVLAVNGCCQMSPSKNHQRLLEPLSTNAVHCTRAPLRMRSAAIDSSCSFLRRAAVGLHFLLGAAVASSTASSSSVSLSSTSSSSLPGGGGARRRGARRLRFVSFLGICSAAGASSASEKSLPLLGLKPQYTASSCDMAFASCAPPVRQADGKKPLETCQPLRRQRVFRRFACLARASRASRAALAKFVRLLAQRAHALQRAPCGACGCARGARRRGSVRRERQSFS